MAVTGHPQPVGGTAPALDAWQHARMNVLVTGSSGRIGRAVLQALQAQGHQAQGLDLRPADTTRWVGDLDDAALRAQALRGQHAVVHAAALHAPHVGQVPDAQFERINVQATRRLAEAALQAGVRRLVYTSTTALYGAGGHTALAGAAPQDAAAPHERAGAAVPWITEHTAPQPRTIYHRSKLAAEGVLADMVAASRGALGVCILRMSRCFPEPAPAMALYRLHRGVDARDVAQAHVLALDLALPAHTAACFIVSGQPPFLPEDARLLRTRLRQVLQRRCPALLQAFDQQGWPVPAGIDRVYDPARAIQQLGWRPQHGFESVLAQWAAGAPQVLPPAAPS